MFTVLPLHLEYDLTDSIHVSTSSVWEVAYENAIL